MQIREGEFAKTTKPVLLVEISWDPDFHVVEHAEIPAGTTVQVESVHNAGFRGIEAFVRLPGTRLTNHVHIEDLVK